MCVCLCVCVHMPIHDTRFYMPSCRSLSMQTHPRMYSNNPKHPNLRYIKPTHTMCLWPLEPCKLRLLMFRLQATFSTTLQH